MLLQLELLLSCLVCGKDEEEQSLGDKTLSKIELWLLSPGCTKEIAEHTLWKMKASETCGEPKGENDSIFFFVKCDCYIKV